MEKSKNKKIKKITLITLGSLAGLTGAATGAVFLTLAYTGMSEFEANKLFERLQKEANKLETIDSDLSYELFLNQLFINAGLNEQEKSKISLVLSEDQNEKEQLTIGQEFINLKLNTFHKKLVIKKVAEGQQDAIANRILNEINEKLDSTIKNKITSDFNNQYVFEQIMKLIDNDEDKKMVIVENELNLEDKLLATESEHQFNLIINGFIKKVNVGKINESLTDQTNRIEQTIIEQWNKEFKNSFFHETTYTDILNTIKNIFVKKVDKKTISLQNSSISKDLISENSKVVIKIREKELELNIGTLSEGPVAKFERIKNTIVQNWDHIVFNLNSDKKYSDILESIRNLFEDENDKNWIDLNVENEPNKQIEFNKIDQKVKLNIGKEVIEFKLENVFQEFKDALADQIT